MTMQAELLELVKKNLPAMASGAILEAFQEAEATKLALEKERKEVAALKETIQHIADDARELQKKIKTDQELGEREGRLDKREAELLTREISLKVLDAEKKAETEKVALMKELVSMIFRGPVMKRIETGLAVGEVNFGPNGQMAYPATVPVNKTIEIEVT